jgi:hypothetical protein
LVVQPISAHLNDIKQGRGEYTLVVFPPEMIAGRAVDAPEPAELADEFGQLTSNGGLSRRAALRALAEKYELPTREVFAMLERARISVE